LIGPSMTQGAVSPSQRSAARKVRGDCQEFCA
jgi:hypothetical protein